MFARFVVGSVLVIAACGGATVPETVDAGRAPSSSSSSSSSSSGGVSTGTSASSGVLIGRDGGLVTAGLVACPDAASSCVTETGSGTELACCVAGNAFSCTPADACKLSTLRCDEGADCKSGVCCAEEATGSSVSSRRLVTTQCRQTCFTGVPRVEVCTSNADCASGTCKVWDCGGFEMQDIKTCAPLGACD